MIFNILLPQVIFVQILGTFSSYPYNNSNNNLFSSYDILCRYGYTDVKPST